MQNWLIQISFQKENPTFYQVPKKWGNPLELMQTCWSKPQNHVKKHGILVFSKVRSPCSSRKRIVRRFWASWRWPQWKTPLETGDTDLFFQALQHKKKKKTSPNNQDNQKKMLPNFGVHGFFLVVFFFSKTHQLQKPKSPAPHGFPTINHPLPTCFTTKPTNHRPSADVEKISSTAGTSTGSTPPPPEVGVGEHQVLEKWPQVDEFFKTFPRILCHKNVKHLKSECSREKRCVCVCGSFFGLCETTSWWSFGFSRMLFILTTRMTWYIFRRVWEFRTKPLVDPRGKMLRDSFREDSY